MKNRTKFNGAEVKAWFEADWGEGRYIDGESWEVNGAEVDFIDFEELKASDEVKIISGTIVDEQDFEASAVKELNKWLKAQSIDLITIEIPKDKREAFEALLSGFPGAKIRS